MVEYLCRDMNSEGSARPNLKHDIIVQTPLCFNAGMYAYSFGILDGEGQKDGMRIFGTSGPGLMCSMLFRVYGLWVQRSPTLSGFRVYRVWGLG